MPGVAGENTVGYDLIADWLGLKLSNCFASSVRRCSYNLRVLDYVNRSLRSVKSMVGSVAM